jgi:hypothetical protein
MLLGFGRCAPAARARRPTRTLHVSQRQGPLEPDSHWSARQPAPDGWGRGPAEPSAHWPVMLPLGGSPAATGERRPTRGQLGSRSLGRASSCARQPAHMQLPGDLSAYASATCRRPQPGYPPRYRARPPHRHRLRRTRLLRRAHRPHAAASGRAAVPRPRRARAGVVGEKPGSVAGSARRPPRIAEEAGRRSRPVGSAAVPLLGPFGHSDRGTAGPQDRPARPANPPHEVPQVPRATWCRSVRRPRRRPAGGRHTQSVAPSLHPQIAAAALSGGGPAGPSCRCSKLP